MMVNHQMAKKYVWQKIGKTGIEREKEIDLSANINTLKFVRKKGLVSVRDVANEFKIKLDTASHRLSRLKKNGYLSSRNLKNKLIFFPTKRGFERLPREKASKKQVPKIIEKEKIKEITKLDKTNYLGEI